MQFVVDETSFAQWTGNDVEAALEDFSFLVGERQLRDEIVRASEELGYATLNNQSLIELLCAKPSTLDGVLRQRLLEFLGRCANLEAVPKSVTISDWSGKAVGIAVAAAYVMRNVAACCLALTGTRPSTSEVTVEDTTTIVRFVSIEAEVLAFYRDVFEIEVVDATKYMSIAPRAFPRLHFMPGLAQQTGRFDEDFRTLRAKLTSVLAILNDEFRAIFDTCKGLPDKIQAQLGPKGMSASRESANTKANKRAWEQRRIDAKDSNGHWIYCDWHIKLRPNKDRVHFHPGTAGFAGGKIIVGIFHEHLDT